MRIRDWSSDVCSSDLPPPAPLQRLGPARGRHRPAAVEDALRAGPELGLGPQRHLGAGRLPRGVPRLLTDGLRRWRHARLRMPPARLGRWKTRPHPRSDRKSDVEGKRVSVRVDLGGRRIHKKKKKEKKQKK